MKDQKTMEQQYDEQLLKSGYKKTIFTFLPQDLSRISSLETISTMGQLAQSMIDNIVQTQCLPRTGTKNSVDTKILYDVSKSQFFVYSPKIWCMLCGVRKAEFEYKGKLYCQSCVDKLKAEEKA